MAEILTAAHVRAAARSLREKNKDNRFVVQVHYPPKFSAFPSDCQKAHTVEEGYYITYTDTGQRVCLACGQEVT